MHFPPCPATSSAWSARTTRPTRRGCWPTGTAPCGVAPRWLPARAAGPGASSGNSVMPSADVGASVERSWPDPRAAVDRLAAADAPHLIGVRHHSPVVAAAVPALLDAMRPDIVLVELPMEFADWLPWIGHPEAEAPLALAGSGRTADVPLAFYPFADFSPELVAIRWALRNRVPVEPCDLPVADRAWAREPSRTVRDRSEQSVADVVRRRLTGRADGDL